MTTSGDLQTFPLIDDPWRRLPWLAPLSILLWMVLLCGFSLLLGRHASPPDLRPLTAQIVEVPVGGLQGDTVAAATAPPAPREKRVPREIPLPKKVTPRKERKEKDKPPPQPAENNSPPSGPVEASTGASSSAEANGPPVGINTGLRGGLDHEGARAIYAPVPKIPDELREEVLRAEAVARFNVSSDGAVAVTLVKPTANPRLNQIVIDTLKQWRFAPAVRGGAPIDAVFEIRIPITVE